MGNVSVTTRASGEAILKEESVEAYRSGLRGELIRPGDPGYDDARKVNNGMHERRPAAIVRAAGVADVIATVKLAREHDLLLAVRGGGHSVCGFGTCDGGIVLDLSRMKGLRVDPERRTVRAEGGCTWGDLNHATHAFGERVVRRFDVQFAGAKLEDVADVLVLDRRQRVRNAQMLL